jgi:hypothetical protein
MSMTGHAKTVDALLQLTRGVGLADYITIRRSAGRSYYAIARELEDDTAGSVKVTGETIRNWTTAVERVAS